MPIVKPMTINHMMKFKHDDNEARGRNGEFKPSNAFVTKYSNDWVSIRVFHVRPERTRLSCCSCPSRKRGSLQKLSHGPVRQKPM